MDSFLQFFCETKSSLTSNDIKEIIDGYKSGMSIADLERKTNILYDTIRRCLIKNGVKIRPTGVKDQEQINKIVQMYNSGVSFTELGRKFNVNHDTIKKYLIDNGVKLRPVGVKDQEQIDKIVQMHNSGVPVEKLGKKFNVSHNTIRLILKKNGAKFRAYRFKNIESGSVDKIKEMYENGMTFKEIAKKLNVDVQVLRRYLKNNKGKFEKPGTKKQLPEIPKKRKTPEPNEDKRMAHYRNIWSDIDTWKPAKLAWLKIIPKNAREKYGKFAESEIGKDAYNKIKDYLLTVENPTQENFTDYLVKLADSYKNIRQRPLSYEEIEALITKLIYAPDWRHSKPKSKTSFSDIDGKLENRKDEFNAIAPYIQRMKSPIKVLSLPNAYAFERAIVNSFNKDMISIGYEYDDFARVKQNAKQVSQEVSKKGHKIKTVLVNGDINADILNPSNAIIGNKGDNVMLNNYRFDIIDLDYTGMPGSSTTGAIDIPIKAAKLLNPGGLLFVTYTVMYERFKNRFDDMCKNPKNNMGNLSHDVKPGMLPKSLYFDPKQPSERSIKYFTGTSWTKSNPLLQAEFYSPSANYANRYTNGLLQSIKKEHINLKPVYLNVYPGTLNCFMYRIVFVKQ